MFDLTTPRQDGREEKYSWRVGIVRTDEETDEFYEIEDDECKECFEPLVDVKGYVAIVASLFLRLVYAVGAGPELGPKFLPPESVAEGGGGPSSVWLLLAGTTFKAQLSFRRRRALKEVVD